MTIAVERCPECEGQLISSGAETVCDDCGLVTDEDAIDHGPEWRAFTSAEHDARSRVGAPTTTLIHDKGLPTKIGWQNQDAYGHALSSRKSEQMKRLRMWNYRMRFQDGKERHLKNALNEISRMASALGLPKTVQETASVIYRRAHSGDLLPGRSLEGVAAAALYAAARQAGTPRTLGEIAQVSRVTRLKLTRTYRYLVHELKLEIEPADPEQYIARIASALDLSGETERNARTLLRNAKSAGIHSGRSPVGMAAAAIYAAALSTSEKVSQNQVSEVIDISAGTIRNRYTELLEV